MGHTIEELEQLLKEAKAAEAAEARAKLDAVPPIWRFYVEPSTRAYEKLYDENCVWYRVYATCTNLEEAREAGHGLAIEASGKGMDYVFNKLSGKIVLSSGGGHVWLGFGSSEPAHLWAIEQVSEFIVRYPEGGDITAIVEQYRRARSRLVRE